MNTTTNSTTTNSSMMPNRRQLDTMCARFTSLRSADAASWLAAGDRLAIILQMLGHRLAQLRAARRVERCRAERRRAERRYADGLAWGL